MMLPLSTYLVELFGLVYGVQLCLFNFRVVSKVFILFFLYFLYLLILTIIA